MPLLPLAQFCCLMEGHGGGGERLVLRDYWLSWSRTVAYTGPGQACCSAGPYDDNGIMPASFRREYLGEKEVRVFGFVFPLQLNYLLEITDCSFLRFTLESAWHMVDTNRCLKQLDEWNVFQSDKWLSHQTSTVSALPHQKRIRKSFL